VSTAIPLWELVCSRDLAEKLGAVSPMTIDHHRRLRNAGNILMRDRATGGPMFWPWALNPIEIVRPSS